MNLRVLLALTASTWLGVAFAQGGLEKINTWRAEAGMELLSGNPTADYAVVQKECFADRISVSCQLLQMFQQNIRRAQAAQQQQYLYQQQLLNSYSGAGSYSPYPYGGGSVAGYDEWPEYMRDQWDNTMMMWDTHDLLRSVNPNYVPSYGGYGGGYSSGSSGESSGYKPFSNPERWKLNID
jgi:hypothetical protein